MIKVAVIGVGSMGKNHARVYNELPNTQLVAVSDSDVKNAESVAARLGVHAYSDHRQMLESERPDAVSIVVPTALHETVATDALNAGAHILVEKPITATLEEGKRLIQRANTLGRKLMVGHIVRFNPAIQALKQKLQAGDLGRIFQIFCRRAGPFPARIRDVGVVIDLAPHVIGFILGLLNWPVVDSVRGWAWSDFGSEPGKGDGPYGGGATGDGPFNVEDGAKAQLVIGGGYNIPVDIEVSWAGNYANESMGFLIHGSESSLHINRSWFTNDGDDTKAKDSMWLLGNGPTARGWMSANIELNPNREPDLTDSNMGRTAYVGQWLDAIAGDELAKSRLASFKNGLSIQRIIDAWYRSEGQIVSLQ